MPRRGSSVTAFCLWSSVALWMAGCAPPGAVSEIEVDARPVVRVIVPDSYDDAGIRLVREEATLRVGDGERRAFAIFPRPRRAYEFREDPPGLEGDFHGRGWEATNETFAVITSGGRVVLALYDRVGVDRAAVDQERRAHELELLPLQANFVTRSDCDSWFWEAGGQRLMVLSYPDGKGGFALVTALGDARVMDALRMSPSAAEADAAFAGRIREAAKPGR